MHPNKTQVFAAILVTLSCAVLLVIKWLHHEFVELSDPRHFRAGMRTLAGTLHYVTEIAGWN